MGCFRFAVGALLAGGLFSGCIEYQPGSTVPPTVVANPRPLEGTTQTDVIIQTGIPEVDVLWLIDNSCSMSEEQEGIASNFPVFLSFFQQTNLDWHIGVVSTDMGDTLHQGKLQDFAGYKYVDPTTPFPEDVLAGMTRLGTTGSGRERGRDPIWYALGGEQAAHNQGFYRDTATLHVVAISDEDDSSEIIRKPEFLSWMRGMKWGEDRLTFSSIVSQPNDVCVDAITPGLDYLDYTDDLGGIKWSICNNNWSQVLTELGIQAVVEVREYFLSQLPIESTIVVTLTQGDTTLAFSDEDWTYDPIRNSIQFVEFVPDEGMIITIEYEVRTGIEPEETEPTEPTGTMQ